MSVPLSVIAPPLVSLLGLTVIRGKKKVLDGVTADVARGRITAVVGLNGSGKSTLLRTLVGEFPFSGQLKYRCGHDHSRPRPEYVGYVPQRLTVDSRMPLTVRDLMALALRKWPLAFGIGRKLAVRIEAALARVGVADLADVPVEGLSGGQLQRVLLALALDPQPELLLLDEPATGIDFRSTQAFYELIADLNRSTGVTVLLVSHDLETVRRIADEVLCLRGGTVTRHGPPSEVLTPTAVAETFGTHATLESSGAA